MFLDYWPLMVSAIKTIHGKCSVFPLMASKWDLLKLPFTKSSMFFWKIFLWMVQTEAFAFSPLQWLEWSNSAVIARCLAINFLAYLSPMNPPFWMTTNWFQYFADHNECRSLESLTCLWGSSGKMAYQTFQQEYMQIPVVTRTYTTACVVTTLAVVNMTM